MMETIKEIDLKIEKLQHLKKYKEHIGNQRLNDFQKMSNNLRKKFNEVHKLSEEILTMVREKRGYVNPENRRIEGEGFILPDSKDILCIVNS